MRSEGSATLHRVVCLLVMELPSYFRGLYEAELS
ncbi:hypothetical protein M3J09_010394 [Ascochyta lentis]